MAAMKKLLFLSQFQILNLPKKYIYINLSNSLQKNSYQSHNWNTWYNPFSRSHVLFTSWVSIPFLHRNGSLKKWRNWRTEEMILLFLSLNEWVCLSVVQQCRNDRAQFKTFLFVCFLRKLQLNLRNMFWALR